MNAVQPMERPAATLKRSYDRHRPLVLWPLVGLMLFLSIGGFIGGISFVTDPTGAGIGARLSWLEETPVSDFLLPGLFLLFVFGFGTLLLVIGLVWRSSPWVLRRVDAWIGFHWSWAATILVGLLLVGWILYEFTIFSDRMALQPILLAVGVLMAAIPLLPSMRGYCRTARKR
jgi:hypothetical protein